MSNKLNAGAGHAFKVKNGGKGVFTLGFEPWDFFWDLRPGEEYEVVFDDAADFWSIEMIDRAEHHLIFWAVYPSAVYRLSAEGKVNMMSDDGAEEASDVRAAR